MSSTVAVVQDWVFHGYFALNDFLQSYSPLALIAATTFITFVIVRLHTIQQSDKGIGKRTRLALFNYLRKIPIVRRKVAEEIRKVNLELTHSMHMTDRTGTFLTSIPEKGMKSDALIQFAEVYNSMEGPRYLEGRVSGAVFNDESNMEEMHVYKEVFTKFAWSNPLWPKLFPGVRKMEAEVVRMCATLMNGDENTCGTMSTGGTISILLACLAHRNRALRKGIEFPEMVLPTSAHAAFTKAGELFRMKIVHIPVDKATYKVDLNIMRRSITSRTAMLVGSAPNFPFGTIDDIEAIAQMGLEHDIPVHVDGCLGGFLLPFLDDAPPFDFRVPGVCSISADTHKYGLAPKGSSVVLYRNKDYLHNQYFCDADWQGGIYASSTMEGSRSGLNIALCWSSLLFHGWQGYQAKSGDVVRTTRQIRDGIAGIPELRLQGDSNWCIVSFTSNVIDIHRFHDLMGRQDWQLSNLQFPSGVHLMVTLNHTAPGVADAFLEACRRCVKEIVQTPNEAPQGAAALYGMAQKIPDRSIVQEFAYAYLDACYSAPSH